MAHMNLYIIYNPILSDFFRQLKKKMQTLAAMMEHQD